MDRIVTHLLFAAITMIIFATSTTVATAAELGLDFSLSSPQTFQPNNNWNIGYMFHVNNNISVISLGTFDNGSVTNFLSSQQVGLWDNNGSLLASAFNDNLSTQIGLWAFTAITPITLIAGNDYVVGSQGDSNVYAGGTPVIVDPRITYLADVYALNLSQSNAPLIEPTLTTGLNSPSTSAGWFGGNIEITDAAPVPEPSTLFLLGIGLAGAGFMRSRIRS